MSTVQEIIDSADARASQSIQDADKYLNALEQLANGIGYDVGYTAQRHEPVPSIYNVDSNLPELQSLELEEVESAVTDSDVVAQKINLSTWGLPQFHDFSESTPVLDMPVRPTLTWPDQPVAPSIAEITTKSDPEKTIPDDPVLTWEPLPVFSEIEIPVFNADVPTLAYLTPSNDFHFSDENYSSELKTKLSELLLDELENGGHGINIDDEQDLFNRARDRESQNALYADQEICTAFAAKGYPIPPGAALITSQKILETAQAKNSSVNRDIALKRADMYVQAHQFFTQHGISWEQAFLTLQNSKMERALNYARATSDFTLKFYGAEVQRFNVELSLYAAVRDAYQAKLTGVRAAIEKEKFKIDKVKLSDERQKNIQEFHKLKILTVNAAYDVYRSQLEAAQIKTNVERLKLDKYKTDNSIYAEQVRSNAVEVDVFKTAADVETIKLDVYAKKLQAHEIKLNSSRQESALKNEQYRAEMDQELANFKVAEQQLRFYETRLNHAIQKSTTKAKENDFDLTAWRNQIAILQGNQTTKLRTELENHKGRIEIIKTNIQYLLDDFNSKVKDADVRQAAADSGTRLYENLIAGTLNSLSAIATLAETAT